MPRHITRTLLAAAAAGLTAALGLTAAGTAQAASTAAAGPASHRSTPPSGGLPVYTAPCPAQGASEPTEPAPGACSGYQASGRDFRFAQAVITVPTTPCTDSSPQLSISLAASGTYAQAGVECQGLAGPNRLAPGPARSDDGIGLRYQAFFTVEQLGMPTITRTFTLLTVTPGDGVFVSIYFDQAGNADRFTVSGPGVSRALTIAVNGPAYTTAYALADWTAAVPATPAQPGHNVRMTQFLQGRFTTADGQRGTFTGPWTLRPVEVTSNGIAPPGGTLISAPSYLWTDGSSLAGLPGDAFGVWLYS
jgi:hypothetical protein